MDMIRHMFARLTKTACNSPKDLVDYWEQFYEDNKKRPDSEFLEHLKWRGGELTSNDLEYLFRWKYRSVPSWDPRPVTKRIRELNELRFKQGLHVIEFAKKFSKGGLVKRYFICHIMSPRKYPIWDQHVLKAYLMISSRDDEIDRLDQLIRNEIEYESYRTSFNDWVAQVSTRTAGSTEFPPFRRLDRALFAMGRYSQILLRSG